LVSIKTGQTNQLRGLLAEFGIVLPKGRASLNKQIPLILEDAENNLTPPVRSLVAHLKKLIDDLTVRFSALTKEIEQWHNANDDSKRIAEIPRIGSITATALVASIGDPTSFNNGRQVSTSCGICGGKASDQWEQPTASPRPDSELKLRDVWPAGCAKCCKEG
jgi:transposase